MNAEKTAWAKRSARWSKAIAGVDPDPSNTAEVTKWCRDYYNAMKPRTPKNLITANEHNNHQLKFKIMKTKLTFLVMIIFSAVFSGCSQKNDNMIVEEQKIDIINDQFPESQAEIKTVLDGIFKSIQDNDADRLISYHVYGPKFTEFRDSEHRFNSADNEQYERGLVGAVSGFDYDLGDLKIDVFGDVAVVTFHADFRPVIGGEVHQIWGSTTLVFVKVDGAWKITHEHHSPLNVADQG